MGFIFIRPASSCLTRNFINVIVLLRNFKMFKQHNINSEAEAQNFVLLRKTLTVRKAGVEI